jgi:hypothetical protein
MAQMLQMNPNLMGSARLKPAMHERDRLVKETALAQGTKFGDSWLTPVFRYDRHLLSVSGVSANGLIHEAANCQCPPDQGEIVPGYGSVLKLAHELKLGLICLCNHHETSRVAVKSVDNSSPRQGQ